MVKLNIIAFCLCLFLRRSLHEEDVFEKIDPTIRYLQKLGPEYLGLIFAWCKWVLDADASRGLQVRYHVFASL